MNPTSKNPKAETNCIIAGGNSLEPILAVKAQAVQQSEERTAYQNHLVFIA
jgi:hypothetical protein